MPPRRGFKLQEYAEHLFERCPGISTVNKIHADLRYTKSIVSGKRINHDLPCTMGEGKLCQILDDLTLWNEFLWLLDLQLLEVAPGMLGVVFLHGEVSAPAYNNIHHRHAWMLLHWLVKEHRCVNVLELETTVFHGSHHLFCDALRVSSGLRRLKLLKHCFTKSESKAVVEAIRSLTMLEELEVSELYFSEDALHGLVSLLKDMKSLKSFSFHHMSVTESEAQIIFEGLATANITALVLGDISMHNEDESYFSMFEEEKMYSLEHIFRMLEQNTVLKKLHLSNVSCHPSLEELVVKAMSKNVTLESLVIDDSYWESIGFEFFAEMVERNTGLRELALPGAFIGCVNRFVEAIEKNAMLQKLTLCGLRLEVTEAEKFFRAVASSCALEYVNLGRVKREVVGDFCRIRKETGTETRVIFKTDFENPVLCCDTFSICKSLGDIGFSFNYRAVDSAVLCEIFDQLKACHWLVKLNISLDRAIDDASAASLARFVSSAKALKDLSLNFETAESTLPVLLEGLSCNKSVSKLFLNPWTFDEPEKRMFSAMFKASMTLNHVTLEAFHVMENDDEDWDDPSFAILLYLPECLSQSYTVIHVDVREDREVEEEMFQIRDTMRRNLSLLQRAVQFTMGVRNKRCAEAFERVHRSEALVTELREQFHVTDPEAREKIKASLRDLNVNFLVVAGVVKREVVCVEQTPGQVTLDKIGVDNWLRIRSYLRVGDVLDDPVIQCPNPCAQRRRAHKRKAPVASS